MRAYKSLAAACGCLAVLCVPLASLAANIANPAGLQPGGRLYVGASYHVGGYSVTDLELGAIMNRFHARIGYCPLQYLNFGIDLGVTQMDVDSVTIVTAGDTAHLSTFQGNYGFSGAVHIKAGTPRLFNDMVGLFTTVQASMFTSDNDDGAYYSGIEGSGVLGLQVRVPKFGFLSVGAKVYYIEGTSKSYNSDTEKGYHNTDNVQGWLALDFIPPFRADMRGKPYFSAEMTLVPGVSMGGSVPLEGISFSLAIGWISPRLYGEDLEDEMQ